jgi:hypothetical protein
MALHKIIVDEFDEDYSLIALHCKIEDYRLAYMLNRCLSTRLRRKAEDLDFTGSNASFSVFEWKDPTFQTDWYLIKNRCCVESDTTISEGLFSQTQDKSVVIHQLMGDHPSVDYFIKIDANGGVVDDTTVLKKIQSLEKISTSYSVDTSQLKTKAHLIFN